MDFQKAVGLMQQGLQYKRLGQYKESLQCYLAAEPILNREAELYKSMGKVYYILGQYEKAINCYTKSIQLTGSMDINILMHMGHAVCDSKSRTDEEKAMAENYRCSIDPYFEQVGNRMYTRIRVSYDANEEYDRKCINTAASLLR